MRLVGYIKNKSITIYGNMNVKSMRTSVAPGGARSLSRYSLSSDTPRSLQ